MDAFITYDISARHSEVKAEMKKLGYKDFWTRSLTDLTIYYLPNTSLWKSNTELATAKADLSNVIDKLNIGAPVKIRLARCIVVSIGQWDGIPGEPHSS